MFVEIKSAGGPNVSCSKELVVIQFEAWIDPKHIKYITHSIIDHRGPAFESKSQEMILVFSYKPRNAALDLAS